MLEEIKKKVKLRKYEGMFLLDNREVKKGWEHGKSLVLRVLERMGIQVQSARRWDERRLAFEIKGRKRATYLLVYFEADPENIADLNNELSLAEGVLRHLILVLEEFPEKAFEPVDDEVDVSQIPLDDEEPVEREGGEESAAGGDREPGSRDEAGDAGEEESGEEDAAGKEVPPAEGAGEEPSPDKEEVEPVAEVKDPGGAEAAGEGEEKTPEEKKED